MNTEQLAPTPSGISSDAQYPETTSPFYEKNREICAEWEGYAKTLGGKIRGKFTSWALILRIDVSTHADWQIKVEKATMSGSHLLISSKRNVLERTTLETKGLDFGKQAIKLRRRKWFDRLGIRRGSRHNWGEDYVVLSPSRSRLDANFFPFLEKLKAIEDRSSLRSLRYQGRSKQLTLIFDSVVPDVQLLNQLLHEAVF